MALEIFSMPKKVGGALMTLIAENHLYHMKNPKIAFIMIQPSKDGSGRYEYERFFLDVKEVTMLVRGMRYGPKDSSEIIKSFKGGMDKKLDKIVSKIFKAEIIKDNLLKLSIDITNGTQTFTLNKYNQKVPGVVKPAGGSSIKQGSIVLNRNEALFVADMLDKELSAWRTVLNFDFMSNPQKYNYNAMNENNMR